MKLLKLLCCFIFFSMGMKTFAQSATLRGIVLDEKKLPVMGVNVSSPLGFTKSNEKGFYQIAVPAEQLVNIVFTHISLQKVSLQLTLSPAEEFEFNLNMKDYEQEMGELIIRASDKKTVQGILSFTLEEQRFAPGANPGIENILKTLAGVNSNNELSTQYSVRGGNYDENLVYVNEVEVYRPFLIRSGQQEGLSFVNTDLVKHIDFSAGGFQAKYGDKLSSVLDITYRNPSQFAAAMEVSLLGASLSLDAVSKDKKWTGITGFRYRDNSLFVHSQDTKSNYKPSFVDLQTLVNYQASSKWQWSFLANLSQNKYAYQPISRLTNFGTVQYPMALIVDYQGAENDRYSTYLAAVKGSYQLSESFSLKMIGSVFHTVEQEYYDILAQYQLGDLDSSPDSDRHGELMYAKGIGSQLNHARNDLDALIANIEVKGLHNWRQNLVQWGLKYTNESIRDRISEWEVIDSTGFSIRPPQFSPKKEEPYVPYEGLLQPYQSVYAINFSTIGRLSAFAQWGHKGTLGLHEIWYNLGLRSQSWVVTGADIERNLQIICSPRAQFAIKPYWEKDMIFRFSIGQYQQPPFYRELRNHQGQLVSETKAQKSLNIVLGQDYSFRLRNRPFKLISEAYFKQLNDVNPYTIENIRIRYAAENNAVAYARGLDMRLNGEFVPGTESWISFGYMKTQENIDHKGYIDRPTDQRLKFGLLFTDYMPKLPGMKVYLNLIYNTGLPGGSPAYADPYLYQYRLKDYRRADIGFSKVFIDQRTVKSQNAIFKHFKELALGVEIFNLFDNQNAITNTWVRDVYTKTEYAIPNYMTSRVFNLRLNARF